jgi:hypothetical protein
VRKSQRPMKISEFRTGKLGAEMQLKAFAKQA